MLFRGLKSVFKNCLNGFFKWGILSKPTIVFDKTGGYSSNSIRLVNSDMRVMKLSVKLRDWRNTIAWFRPGNQPEAPSLSFLSLKGFARIARRELKIPWCYNHQINMCCNWQTKSETKVSCLHRWLMCQLPPWPMHSSHFYGYSCCLFQL